MHECQMQPECDEYATHQLVYGDSQGEHTEYYCEEHLELAIEETESDQYEELLNTAEL